MSNRWKNLTREEAIKQIRDAISDYGKRDEMAQALTGWLDALTKPIDMILFCPTCGVQHVDAPEPHHLDAHFINAGMEPTGEHWTNPPHKSHLCHACGCIWRPADVPTNGVQSITTKGKADNFAERRELLKKVLR